MAYTEQEARELVIQAGHRLLETGLIARTWGNISARISDTQFVITPSGLAYETLLPEQLVKVNICDCAHEGPIKPSSEKGIHADAYRLRPGVQFVIHTHQAAASIYGVAGSDLRCDSGTLGRRVPCAAYGLSSTKKLRRAVTEAACAHPDSPAVLMRHHGALCMGADFEDAFAVAEALEAACDLRLPPIPAAGQVRDFGCSQRFEGEFSLTLGGAAARYALESPADPVAAVHGAIYQSDPNIRFIHHVADPQVVTVSGWGQTVRPLLDDLVQIAGVSLRCADSNTAARALKGRNAVFLKGAGALCAGATASDVEAACILLAKDCRAQLFGREHPGCKPVGALDAWIERTIYVKKYAKKQHGG